MLVKGTDRTQHQLYRDGANSLQISVRRRCSETHSPPRHDAMTPEQACHCANVLSCLSEMRAHGRLSHNLPRRAPRLQRLQRVFQRLDGYRAGAELRDMAVALSGEVRQARLQTSRPQPSRPDAPRWHAGAQIDGR
jgi:hypothetical protein